MSPPAKAPAFTYTCYSQKPILRLRGLDHAPFQLVSRSLLALFTPERCPTTCRSNPLPPQKRKPKRVFGSFHLKAGSRSAVHLELQYSHKVSSGEQMTPRPLAPLGNSCRSAGPSSASSARTSVASHCGKSVRFDESPFFCVSLPLPPLPVNCLSSLSLDTSARANVISDDEYIHTTSHHHDRCSSAPVCDCFSFFLPFLPWFDLLPLLFIYPPAASSFLEWMRKLRARSRRVHAGGRSLAKRD